MLHPILTIDEKTDTSNGYFYDHLHNQLYLVQGGQLFKRPLNGAPNLIPIPITIHLYQNNDKIFQSLVKIKGDCILNLQRSQFTTESDAVCNVRTDVQINEGSVWQWHVPGSLAQVNLGVVEVTKSGNIFETFANISASSSRTVTFTLTNDQLKIWVNGQPLSRDHSILLKAEPSRDSKFYPVANVTEKGKTLIFNPFSKVPNESSNYKFKTPDAELKVTQPQNYQPKLKKIIQLNKDKLLLITENDWIKIIHRNSTNNLFEFPSISVKSSGQILGLFTIQEFAILTSDAIVQEQWKPQGADSGLKPNQLKKLIESSIYMIQKTGEESKSQAYRILIQKATILRSLSYEFALVNPIYESQFDRSFNSETNEFFQLPKIPSNSFSKSIILNQEGWTKIEGKIEDITENYILAIDEETVIVYNIGERVKEVFKENIVFFEFSKSSFLERFNQSDLRVVKKGEKSSSIYKLLMNCFSKDKKAHTELFAVKENDLTEMINDYKVSESDAKLSLRQAGSVEEALVWLSRPQSERVYIQKPEQLKSKANEQGSVSGSLLQLHNVPLTKLLLKVNNQIYLLGYDPTNLTNCLTKGEKQFINLFDFKRQSNIEDVDQSSWFNSKNHLPLTILDGLNLKEKCDFLFKENQRLFVCKTDKETLFTAQINLNSKLLFQSQVSVSLSAFQPLGGANVTRDINGYIFWNNDKQLQGFKCPHQHTFVHNDQLFTTLSSNTQNLVQIEVSVSDQKFIIPNDFIQQSDDAIPLLIESGPPGVSNHYKISSILNPGATFLANYPKQIKLKNANSSYMRVSSVFIERDDKKLTVNQLKEGWIYFENESGMKSKKYQFTFGENELNKTIKIDQKGFWKFMVLSPVFSSNKKMPFEFGFIRAKGSLIESKVYKEILFRLIQQALILEDVATKNNVSFEVKNVNETSQNVLKLTLKPNKDANSWGIQVKSLFDKVLSVASKRVLKPELSQEQEQEEKILKNIQKVDRNDLMVFFSKTSLKLHLIKQIANHKTLFFTQWSQNAIRKFIDLVLPISDELKPEVFKALFDKIDASQHGRNYINELCKNISALDLILPQRHLSYFIKKIDPTQLQQTLKDLLQKLPKLRSEGYKDIRKKKIPYLLLEQSFYSKFYLDQIQKLQKITSTDTQKFPAFQELTFLSGQIAVIRDEFSRKLYVKLDSYSSVSSVVLRFDRSQALNRIHYKVFSLQSERTLISKGSVSSQQWDQVTKNTHPLNAFIINLNQTVKTDLLEIQILYNETGIAASEIDLKNFPFIDIIPEIYGDQASSSNQLQSSKGFELISKLFNFTEEDGFYLSTVDFCYVPLEKFSISRQNEYEYTYFKPSAEKIENLRVSITQKIQKKDYHGVISDHKKLVRTFRRHSKKPNLDYVFTLLMITFEEIFNKNVILTEDLCKGLFEKIITQEVGPIRISAFKAASGCVNYLIKSLPFIEEQGYMPNLEKVTFHRKDLEEISDLKNVPLCNSLNKLVVSSISYEDQWAKFLIQLNPITQKYEENIMFILNSGKPWYKVPQILTFFDQIPETLFSNILVQNINGPTLVEYILESKKLKKTSRSHLLIEKLIQIYNGKIELDIISLMLEEKDIKWHNLYKITKICPEAQSLILNQFLELGKQIAVKLASSYPEIVNLCAKSAKHSQNFAAFLRKLFESNRNTFKNTVLNLSEDIENLHSDMFEVLIFYLYEECNFGGVQGSKILTESQLFSIHVAQILFKKINFSQIDKTQLSEANQDEILIEWYFCNNGYEQVSLNPANKSPGLLLIKSLSDKILQLIQNRPIDKILKVFDRLIRQIQNESISLSTKHIYINQINEGVQQLLGKSINPQSLSEILVSGENSDMLKRIFESLAVLSGKSASSIKEISWEAKEIDFIEKFSSKTSLQEKIKDWQANRNGSKNVLFKVPVSEKRINFATSDSQGHTLSKILIGFNAPDNPQKSNIYPVNVQVYGGDNENNLIKICDLKEIKDQQFETFGTRIYGVNFNSLPLRKCSSPVKMIEFRLGEPLLTSLSDLFENSQKTKKDAVYSVSFISLMGFESQPQREPSYNQIYMTLLSFLSEEKYENTLKKVVESAYYKQKSGEILRLLNSLLPNKEIEALLLALNSQNQDVLGSIFENKRPNMNLIQLLLEANPSAKNIAKLLKYFIGHPSEKLTPIIVSSIKLFSYSNAGSKIDSNVDEVIKVYESSGFKNSVFNVLAAVLSTPNSFSFDYNALVDEIWAKEESSRVQFYKLIGATIAHYTSALSNLLSSGKTHQLTTQLTTLISSHGPSVHNHIYLLSQLSLHQENRQFFIKKEVPITIVNSLRNEETLLNKDYAPSMKYFILFFQSTCIQSSCEDAFSQILIDLMVELPEVAAAHHNFFIHEFFFPLINAFKGVSVKFVWKSGQGNYLHQATHALKNCPIKSDDKVLIMNGLYLEQSSFSEMKSSGDPERFVILNKDNQVMAQKVELSNDTASQYKVYRNITKETTELLTNQTLIKLRNAGIFGSNYLNKVPVQDSTFEQVYYLPCEISLNDALKQINFCGFRLNDQAVKNTEFALFGGKNLPKQTPLEEVLPADQSHFAVIELNPENLFSNITIDNICKNQIEPPVFIPQKTIFKAFEKKQGLMQMIKVLNSCVKNWNNREQSKIWQQYLNELKSYSCFPVFSSLYMNKQDNVQLLFDILSGLPDKQNPKKWVDLEKTSVKFLYNIVKDVFEVEGVKALEIRKYAVENGFYKTMLGRLHLVSKQPKRSKVEQIPEEEQISLPTDLKKMASEEDYKLKVVKKKGIGYGTDSSSNQKWDITGQEETRKEVHTQILHLLKILEKFLDHKLFEPTKEIVEQSYESALLPILESSLRGGSLLEISKSAQLFKGELSFIKALTKKKALIPILMSIPKCYEPKQHQSVFELLKVLESTSKIFLTCLTGSVSEKLSEEIAKGIIDTYELVQNAVSNYQLDNVDEDEEKKILELPLTKKYPLLLKDLRFDYVDMKDKNGKITKHHYHSNFVANHKSPPAKTIRLAQELADISHALPVEHTNAIYVRCDKERVDFMQALIMGSNGTPYGHGAYLFDIYFDDTYPNNPPKVNLTTTGNGQIRFNPNLYSCGKVCLSLLGTWRGSAMENWDAKVSTLLQVLVSIQSIIMSEEVYFNEPGFEHQQGTPEGEKKNQAYANIVRYGNVKFAMIENIKNPPKGFQHIIRRHFYLKKDQILEQTRKWLKYAQKREASYTGLISDHNNNWSNTFKKSKTEYRNMLEKAIQQLEEQLNKLPEPSSKDLKSSSSPKKQKKKQVKILESKDENIEEVDVTYDKTEQGNLKQLDINDEKVKDRWSRYIGAMGIEAVSKQSKASILLFGLGATGVEIAKNIILSGCKRISIADENNTQITDLSGQFFLDQEDIGKNRVDACLYKLQELNHYVRVEGLKFAEENLEILKSYDVVILTEQNLSRQKLINDYCHKNCIKFIITDCYGPFGQHFNDFGSDFEVLDKNGEETVEVMIESITNAEKGVVTLLNNQRHPYEDGDAVRISGVKGMTKQNGDSIDGTIHKIRVINQFSFEIGNTLDYSPYEIDGVARNMKLPIKVDFKPLEESLKLSNIDANLAFYDFEKSTKNAILHKCFIALSTFRQKHNKYPVPWNWQDGQTFVSMVKEIYTQELKAPELNFIRIFAYTCSGTFAPLAAFFGGLTAQQAFKAITGKYMPINQYFFTEFTEVVPSLPETEAEIQTFLQTLCYKESTDSRNEGLRRVIGNELTESIEKCRVFLIGSGAIGCELLKNYAMINLATSKEGGQIIVTDPDHIEESNLNRQFLFREKHLRKPKSVTAAAAVSQMNKLLKGKIRAKLDRVCQNTKQTFSNEFFESLNIVTNALDNVKARQYVDQRCVENKVALLQSGTLSSKGHVQVILPYITQTYGSKADPAEEGEIPHCTLKMFPEQTLHCVEWARDIFGKTFTLDPKALGKLVEKWQEYNPTSADLEMLKSCFKLLEKKPQNFEQAVKTATYKFFELYRNDIKQLLYTYPLDAKTKDGKPFWKLPKRPPTPIEQIDPNNELHRTFIVSYAVLLCKLFNVDYPKDFRKEEKKIEISKEAAKIEINPFVPNDKLAKQMAEEVDKNETGQEETDKMEESEGPSETEEEAKQQVEATLDETGIFSNIKKILQSSKTEIKVSAEEFEKDDDQNGHIDLIYSMANLRASNYKLEAMDWMTTKLKAGRITPALSTTTSCVAALQTIELIKYLKKCKLEKMRNTFINLAVPIVQAGEPGQVEKIKIHQNLTTNIWERWEIGPVNIEKITVGELLSSIEDKYKIEVKILSILEGAQIYSDLVMGLESKKDEKASFLKKSLKEVLLSEISADELKKFIDLTLVFATNDVLAKHVPTLRLKLNE